MGTNNSSLKNSSNYIYNPSNVSDYFGIEENISDSDKIDNYSKLNFDTQKSEEIKVESNITSKNSDKIPTTFEWDNGGENVYVTGSFCDWKLFFLMKKNEKGIYYLTLNLPKGNHKYKFKVDNQWKFNEKFPTCNDSGYINNYLDTTNWEITVENTDEATAQSTNIAENNEIFENKNSTYLIMKKYSNYKPAKEEFNEKIPPIPWLYRSTENINLLSKQKKIGEEKYLNIIEKDILSGNISYKTIENIHHDQINHLISNEDKNKDNKINIYSISSRYRLKLTTFVYYNSQKKEIIINK